MSEQLAQQFLDHLKGRYPYWFLMKASHLAMLAEYFKPIRNLSLDERDLIVGKVARMIAKRTINGEHNTNVRITG